MTRKLTVNVGVNYSLEFPITDRDNREMWFNRNVLLPVSIPVGFPVYGGFEFASPQERSPTDL